MCFRATELWAPTGSCMCARAGLDTDVSGKVDGSVSAALPASPLCAIHQPHGVAVTYISLVKKLRMTKKLDQDPSGRQPGQETLLTGQHRLLLPPAASHLREAQSTAQTQRPLLRRHL